MSEFSDILKLSELLNPNRNKNPDDEDDDDIGAPIVKDLGPADLNKTVQIEDDKKLDKKDKTKLDPEEALDFLENETSESDDWKKSPQWNITYRQQITPSDVFLQMGGKTPATSSCEDMIITVDLPGEDRQNIDLKITRDRLKVLSPHFRLDVPLPHPIDPQKGNAQYDSKAEKLIITLNMSREFDYINF